MDYYALTGLLANAEKAGDFAFLGRIEFYIVVVYLLLMISIGVFFSKRMKGGVDYFAGGRAIPWWVSGISLYMANFSAWLFTGGAGFLYNTTGFGLLHFFLQGSAGYLLGALLAAAHWRRTRVISPVEFTRTRFGVGTQQLLSVVFALIFLTAAGNQLLAIANVVNEILGVPLNSTVVAIGIIVILYTLLGGLWAVMVTDVVQFVILLGASLLVAPLAIGLLPGGLGEMLSNVDFSIPAKYQPASNNMHFLVAILFTTAMGVASGQGPRFYSVPEERSARKVGILAAILFLSTPLLFSIPSLVARSLWPDAEALTTIAGITADHPHERVFIVIVQKIFSPGLLGIFLAAMFAATMSALDSYYNQVASMLSRDVYMHFRPETSDERLMGVGKVMTLFCGVVVIVLAVIYQGIADLFTIMITIFGLSGPPTATPLILGLFYRKAPRSAAYASIIWGIVVGLVTTLLLGWPFGPRVLLTHACCIALFLASPWLGKMWKRQQDRLPLIIVGFLFGVMMLGVLGFGSPKPQDAPDVTFKTGENASARLSEMRDDVVVVVFGDSTTPLGDKVFRSALSMRNKQDSENLKLVYVSEGLNSGEVNNGVVFSSDPEGEISKAFKPGDVSYVFVVDKFMKIRYKGDFETDEVEKLVGNLLKEQEPGYSFQAKAVFKLGSAQLRTPFTYFQIIFVTAIFMGASLIYFASVFSRDGGREEVDEFYKRLDTPVDVKKEVKGRGKAALEVFRLVGILTYIVAGIVLLVMTLELIFIPKNLKGGEAVEYVALSIILTAFGSFFFLSGVLGKKKIEERERLEEAELAAAQESANRQEDGNS